MIRSTLAMALTAPILALSAPALGQAEPTVPLESDPIEADPLPTPFGGGAADSSDPFAERDALIADYMRRPVIWQVDGGGFYQFRTDLENGGSVEQWRAVAGALGRFQISEDFSIRVNIGYQYDGFNFRGGGSGIVGSPWSNINTLGLGASFDWRLGKNWFFGIGPVLQLSGEAQADAGDSLTGGGIVSAAYRFDDSLLLGIGIIVTTQLEDDVQVFPIPIVDWKINRHVRLSSISGPTAILRGGVELIWTPDPDFEFGVGVRYEKIRFRLAEGSTVSDGIGRQRSVPFYVRAAWIPKPGITLGAFAGVRFGSNIAVFDSGGAPIENEDLDPAPLLGLYGQFNF